MKDYLEALLEALAQEEEKEGTVPAPPPGGWPAGGRAGKRARKDADVNAGVQAPLAPEEKRDRTAAETEAGGPAAQSDAETGGVLERILQTERFLSVPEGVRGRDGVEDQARAAKGSGGGWASGAAVLERRVADSLTRTAAVRAERGGEREPETGGWPGLEELDRRLERDARRYDGGMGIF